jgi:nucleotide-binding universal stress UspA family protein
VSSPVARQIRTVGVGFDGSPESVAALSWAGGLCASVGSRLKVVHVVGLLEEARVPGHPPVSESTAMDVAVASGLTPDRVEWVSLEGSPADALLRATADPHSLDLLVVGTRGAGRRPGTVLGSTSLELAERSTVPVAIVPLEP